MRRIYDVLVIGGGVVGLTAAIAMAERQYSVAVIDAGSLTVNPALPELRVYAINQASQTLLQELNVWQYVDKKRISPYKKMHVWDGINGSCIDFDSRTIAASSLGIIIEEAILKQALLQKVSSLEKISLFAHSRVNEVSNLEQGMQVLSEGKQWEGRLLMVADGANSPTRQKLKVELTTWSYNQQALIATVKTEKPHQQTAYQVFNPDGPLAFLPLVNSHHCSIVWSADSNRAQQLMALSDEEFNLELDKAFAQHLGKAQLITSRHQFPLHMRHAKQSTGPGWVLLGDAAHTLHPLAGLGLNVGLADVRAWITHLDAAPQPILGAKSILAAFQRERKHAVWQTILLLEGLKRLYGTSALPVTLVRGLGLRLCNSLSLLKRLFISHAAG